MILTYLATSRTQLTDEWIAALVSCFKRWKSVVNIISCLLDVFTVVIDTSHRSVYIGDDRIEYRHFIVWFIFNSSVHWQDSEFIQLLCTNMLASKSRLDVIKILSSLLGHKASVSTLSQ